MEISNLLSCTLALVMGIGLPYCYVRSFPGYRFSVERLPSAPSPQSFAQAVAAARHDKYYATVDVALMAELYYRLTSHRQLYIDRKEDYEKSFDSSPLLFAFILLLIAPLLAFRTDSGYDLLPAAVYVLSFALSFLICRRGSSCVKEDDCPPAPAAPAEFKSPREFLEYWERVERIQWPAIRFRVDTVSEMIAKAKDAEALLLYLLFFAVLRSLL